MSSFTSRIGKGKTKFKDQKLHYYICSGCPNDKGNPKKLRCCHHTPINTRACMHNPWYLHQVETEEEIRKTYISEDNEQRRKNREIWKYASKNYRK